MRGRLGRILMRANGKWFVAGKCGGDPCRGCKLYDECLELDNDTVDGLSGLCASVYSFDEHFVGLDKGRLADIMKETEGGAFLSISDCFLKTGGKWFRSVDSDPGQPICECCHIRDECRESRVNPEGRAFLHFCGDALPGKCMKRATSFDVTVFHGYARDWPIVVGPVSGAPGSASLHGGGPPSPEMREIFPVGVFPAGGHDQGDIKAILVRDSGGRWHKGPGISRQSPVCNDCSLSSMCIRTQSDTGGKAREMMALSNFCCAICAMDGRNFNRMTGKDADALCAQAGLGSSTMSESFFQRVMRGPSIKIRQTPTWDGGRKLSFTEYDVPPVVKNLYVRESGVWNRLCYTGLEPWEERKASGLWRNHKGTDPFWKMLDGFFGHTSGVRKAVHGDVIRELEKMEEKT